jgi:hypothetical protein
MNAAAKDTSGASWLEKPLAYVFGELTVIRHHPTILLYSIQLFTLMPPVIFGLRFLRCGVAASREAG